MKLSNIAQRNYAEPGRIAYNAAMYLAIEQHNGKEMMVCRPHAKFLQNEAFMQIFAHQGMVTASYTNPRCLKYISYRTDERGPFWYMSPGNYLSLAQLMVDNPSARINEKWVDSTINDLLENIQYVHAHLQLLIEITPHSILVTKDALNLVTFMPPLTDFIPLKEFIWASENESIAPELFNAEEPDRRADLYGAGRIIKYLHPYPSLPYRYSQIVAKAINERVDVRPASANHILSAIQSRKKQSDVARISFSVATVLAIFGLLLFFPWSDEPEHDIKTVLSDRDSSLLDDRALSDVHSLDPLVNTNIESATQAEKERMLDDYLHDSSYLSMDTAQTLSPEMKEYQRNMMKISAEKFRSAFKLQARPILSKIYTPENLKSQEKFMQASQEANLQLVNIQNALTEQYQIDPTTAIRIAGEVYDEIMNSLKKQAEK